MVSWNNNSNKNTGFFFPFFICKHPLGDCHWFFSVPSSLQWRCQGTVGGWHFSTKAGTEPAATPFQTILCFRYIFCHFFIVQLWHYMFYWQVEYWRYSNPDFTERLRSELIVKGKRFNHGVRRLWQGTPTCQSEREAEHRESETLAATLHNWNTRKGWNTFGKILTLLLVKNKQF